MITRRDFIKVGAISSLFLLLPIGKLLKAAAMEAEFKGRIYRGNSNGEIYVSDDQRNTWNKHINLGGECAISKIFSNTGDSLHAEIDYQGHPFYLSLSLDEKNWMVI